MTDFDPLASLADAVAQLGDGMKTAVGGNLEPGELRALVHAGSGQVMAQLAARCGVPPGVFWWRASEFGMARPDDATAAKLTAAQQAWGEFRTALEGVEMDARQWVTERMRKQE